ncbi:MAG: N-acetylmuramidase domain-containing protein [Pseudomonadales bacterium]|jgi:hypothetical protein|nr:N-acetylmuramidase domain-containing protein [Pseudomonadales bacterium]
MMPIPEFTGRSKPLTDAGILAALATLGLQTATGPATLWAVLTVESAGFGFLPDRRPMLLFERHVFFKETDGRFATEAPDLCAQTRGAYVGGAAEYERLTRAMALCRRDRFDTAAALRSASWGLGQIMGFNAAAAGFRDINDMLAQMADAEDAQLAGMVAFIRRQGLDKNLQAGDWAGFALGYNGTKYAQNAYDTKLQAAFAKQNNRNLRMRAAQAALLFLGYRPGLPDGTIGRNTRAALLAFRRDAGLGDSEALDEPAFNALMQEAALRWP